MSVFVVPVMSSVLIKTFNFRNNLFFFKVFHHSHDKVLAESTAALVLSSADLGLVGHGGGVSTEGDVALGVDGLWRAVAVCLLVGGRGGLCFQGCVLTMSVHL